MSDPKLEYTKNFDEWFVLKPKLDLQDHQPPLTKQGQIWWCHLGENIGTEISGKNTDLTRPVIIFKRLSRYTFLVIPCSTQTKEGSWFSFFTHNKKQMVACLNQVKIIDYRRLKNKVGILDDKDFQKISLDFGQLYVPDFQKNKPSEEES